MSGPLNHAVIISAAARLFRVCVRLTLPLSQGTRLVELRNIDVAANDEEGKIVGYGIVMLGVCMLACVVPTRRALNIEPTVALRTE